MGLSRGAISFGKHRSIAALHGVGDAKKGGCPTG